MHSPDPEYARKRPLLVNAFWQAVNCPATCVLLVVDEVTYYRQPTLAPCYHERGAQLPHVATATATTPKRALWRR